MGRFNKLFKRLSKQEKNIFLKLESHANNIMNLSNKNAREKREKEVDNFYKLMVQTLLTS